MTVLRLCLFVLAAACAWAQNSNTGGVSGQVVSQSTGEGLRKARVTLYGGGLPQPQSMKVEGDGSFSIRNLRPGDYTVVSECPGYLSSNKSHTKVSVGSDEVKGIVLKLVASAVIAGRVLDDSGKPLVNAWVAIMGYEYDYASGRRMLRKLASGETNDLGQYRIWGLRPARYYVRATYEPPWSRNYDPDQDDRTDDAYAPVFYPGVSDEQTATTVYAASGVEASGIDFRLSLVRAYRIRGQVVAGEDSQPIDGADISLTKAGSEISRFASRGPNGQFEYRGLTPGVWHLSVTGRDNSGVARAERDIVISDRSVGVVVPLRPVVLLRGRVKVEGRQDWSWKGARASLINAAGRALGAVPIEPDGSFEFPAEVGGTGRVEFGGMTGVYLKSARLGGTDVLDAQIDLMQLQPQSVLECVLGTRPASLSGTVQGEDSKGVAAAQLVLWRASGGSVQMTQANETGAFLFRDLRPGEYKVIAFREFAGDWRDPSLPTRYAEKAAALTLGENSRETRTLPLAEAAPEDLP